MSEAVVYTSKVKIERVRGPLRRAYLPQEDDPVVFGVHSEIVSWVPVKGEGIVGTDQEFRGRGGNAGRKTLSAQRRICRHGRPAPFLQQFEGTMKTGRHLDGPGFKTDALAVSLAKGRQNLLQRQVARFVDDQVKGPAVEGAEFFTMRKRFGVELLKKNKVDVPAVCN